MHKRHFATLSYIPTQERGNELNELNRIYARHLRHIPRSHAPAWECI